MICREVRDLTDSFLSEQLLVETNHEILHHLDTCSECRATVATQRELRASVHRAFVNAQALRIPDDFRAKAASRLRSAAFQKPRRGIFQRRWAVASVVAALFVITAGVVQLLRPPNLDAIALDAVGDHQNCAVQFRLAEKPISLEEAATRYDGWFRLLQDTPSDEWPTPEGAVRVVGRHSCVFQGRRFAHIVLEVQGQTVSLLVTHKDGPSAQSANGDGPLPLLISLPPVDGFRVVSFQTPRYVAFVVGSMGERQLRQVAQSLSAPLYARLTGSRGDMTMNKYPENSADVAGRAMISARREQGAK